MTGSISFTAWLRRGLTGLLMAGFAAASSAAPTWAESSQLASWFDNNYTYSSDAGTRTGTVTYHNQVATNTGTEAAQLGMYIGWTWSYDGSGAATSLLWSNADQAFVGGGVKMSITGGSGTLRIGDVVNDTWVGNPWTPGAPAAGIATDADWVVPFFDFGVIAGGDSVLYDVTINVTFDTQAAFDDWNRSGSYYIGAQGVAAVPEPASLALALLALAGLGLGTRFKRR